jgi:flagellar biosynthesis anti-sigma factor FlgM
MNPINNVSVTNGTYKVQPAAAARTAETAAPSSPAPARANDRVELSGMQNFLQALKTNDVRVDKVSEIRSQIDAGNYDVDGKLDQALDRLLDDLAEP